MTDDTRSSTPVHIDRLHERAEAQRQLIDHGYAKVLDGIHARQSLLVEVRGAIAAAGLSQVEWADLIDAWDLFDLNASTAVLCDLHDQIEDALES